jgi:nucleotide-binding universal stress UspA family protein
MFRKIVAAIDADETRTDAVLSAAEGLSRALGAEVLVAHVRELERPGAMVAAAGRPGALQPLVHLESDSNSQSLVDDGVARLRRMGIAVRGHVADGGASTARQLIDVAEAFSADLIIVGDRASALSDVVLGGVAHRIVRLADCSVLLVR